MSSALSAIRRVKPAVAAAVIAAVLLITFWVRAQVAISGKSSTYDEPMHALGAWVHWHVGDWRINFEDPPLWHYWAALANGLDSITVDYRNPRWQLMPDEWNHQWPWTREVLYLTPGNDGEAFVQRSRSMMIVIGVALGAVIAWWSYKIAGIVAAVAVTVIFSLDPNFLVHSALVKNDVSMALCTAGLCMALWRMGHKLTPWNLLGAAVSCGAAMATKFSGVLMAPAFLASLLLVRVVIPRAWPVFKWQARVWWQRFLVAGGVGIVVALFSAVMVWAAYGFSFPAIPDPSVKLNINAVMQQGRQNLFLVEHGAENIDQEKYREAILGYIKWHTQRFPDDKKSYDPAVKELAKDVTPWVPPTSTRMMLWMRDKQLMPQAWLDGLLFVEARSYVRGSFLNGQFSNTGFRSYFPLAMLYKTPIATIAAILGAITVAIALLVVRLRSRTPEDPTNSDLWMNIWLAAVIIVPVFIYMWVSIRSNLNIGFRHVIPIYPLIYVGVAAALAAVVRWRFRVGVGAGAALAAVLLIESIAISPDYLTFFNILAGGQRGGLEHLGDSNLDWGQDLPSLAEYMKRPENRDATLYLAYFGMVPPEFYGLRFVKMPASDDMDPAGMWPSPGSLVAISATRLQGIYAPADIRPEYQKYQLRKPTAILGGSIYIFDDRKK